MIVNVCKKCGKNQKKNFTDLRTPLQAKSFCAEALKNMVAVNQFARKLLTNYLQTVINLHLLYRPRCAYVVERLILMYLSISFAQNIDNFRWPPLNCSNLRRHQCSIEACSKWAELAGTGLRSVSNQIWDLYSPAVIFQWLWFRPKLILRWGKSWTSQHSSGAKAAAVCCAYNWPLPEHEQCSLNTIWQSQKKENWESFTNTHSNSYTNVHECRRWERIGCRSQNLGIKHTKTHFMVTLPLMVILLLLVLLLLRLLLLQLIQKNIYCTYHNFNANV